MAENHIQKGTELVGGAASAEALASSSTILSTAGKPGQKGLQQFFTPEKAADLALKVIGNRLAVLDPTAGDGSFLRPFDAPNSFGVEIDRDQIKNSEGGYNAIHGDLQQVYPLLRLGLPDWDAIVCNPPFGLMWEDPTIRNGKPTNSAVAAFLYCTRLLAEDGQLVFIDGKTNFYNQIADLPDAAGVYAVIECDDLGKHHNHNQPCVIAFAVHPACRSAGTTGYVTRQMELENLDLLSQWVLDARQEAMGAYSHVATHTYSAYTLVEKFKTIQTEHDRRTEKRLKENREFDAMIGHGNTIQWLPSNFANLALAQKGDARAFNGLHGQGLNYFAQQERIWRKLVGYEEMGLIRIQPKLKDAVDDILAEIHRVICPLYEVKPQQRLGFLTDVEFIKCIKDSPETGHVAGEDYRLSTDTFTMVTDEKRIVESKKNPGDYEEKEFRVTKKMMRIVIGRHTIYDGGDQASQNIAWLIDTFELPDPGEVANKHPKEIEAAEKKIEAIFQTFKENDEKYRLKNPKLNVKPFQMLNFQRQDVARLFFKGGGVLCWEQGLGKTPGGLAFSEAAVQDGAQDARLFITAKDLIPQWTREIERFLGKKPTLIKSHGQAKKIAKQLRNGGTGLFITYYEALSQVGTRKSVPEDHFVVEEREEMKQVKFTDRYGNYWVEEVVEKDEEGNPVTKQIQHFVKSRWNLPPEAEGKDIHYGYIKPRYEKIVKSITTKEVCPECRADTRNGWNGLYCEAEKEDGSVCGYAHYKVRVKPISNLLSQAFRNGVIVMDEITLISGSANGGDSKRSRAIRGMSAKYRLGMTGTPIKNYINQAFWPLWWALGNNSKRFGYVHDGGRTKFENDFAVIEQSLDSKGRVMGRKAKPEVTNLSLLWRMLASSIIRRRKEETGEDIVPKYFYEIETPLGIGQREQIDSWLKNFPALFAEKYPDSKIVKAGMHEIMAPMLGLQQKLDYACTIPLADPDYEWTGVDVSNYTPSTFRVIELAMALVKDGRKVLIGSGLKKTARFLAESLEEKGVKAIHLLDELDNTADPDKRAAKVHSFQTDDVQVFCAGVKAIRLGHNLDAADAVILHGMDWDWETMDQFVNRVHRFTSENPIDIYVVLPQSDKGDTMTTKKWAVLGMKGAASELALDGRLILKEEAKVDEASIIREMMERGIAASETDIAEEEMYEAYEDLATLEDFVAPDGLIPDRPVYTVSEEEATLAVAEFIFAFGESIREKNAAASLDVMMEKFRVLIEEEKAAAEVVGSFLHKLALIQAAEEMTPEPTEELVTNATSSDDPSANPVDEKDAKIAALEAQMAQMAAMLEEMKNSGN